jgi:hypothetical protein
MTKRRQPKSDVAWIFSGWRCEWCGARQQYNGAYPAQEIELMGAEDRAKNIRYIGGYGGLLPFIQVRYWTTKHHGPAIRNYVWYPLAWLKSLPREALGAIRIYRQLCRCPCEAGDSLTPAITSWRHLFREDPQVDREKRDYLLLEQHTEWLEYRDGRTIVCPKDLETALERMMAKIEERSALFDTGFFEGEPARDHVAEGERARAVTAEEAEPPGEDFPW